MVAPRITQAIVAKTKMNKRAMILLTVDMVSSGFAAGEDIRMEERSRPCQSKNSGGAGMPRLYSMTRSLASAFLLERQPPPGEGDQDQLDGGQQVERNS